MSRVENSKHNGGVDPQSAERMAAKQGSDDLLRRYSDAARRNGLGWIVRLVV